jgi:WD40 repeat protein
VRHVIIGLLLFHLPRIASAQDTLNQPVLVPSVAGHTARVNRVLFTPDGIQLISVSHDKTIRIWDVNGGQTLRVLRPPIGPGPEGLLAAAALTPDGKTLAVGGFPIGGGRLGFPIYLVELPAGRIARLLHGHKGPVSDLAFSPDGKRLASTSYDKTLRIWDIGSDEKEKILEGHEHYVNAVAWSPNGQRLATASFDRTGRLWSLETGECQAVLKGHTKEVHCVAWSRDAKTIATGGDDQAIRLWSPSGKPGQAFENLGNRITSLTFTLKSKALLVTRGSPDFLDHTCSMLSIATGAERLKFTKNSSTVMHGTLSPDGALAATCGGFAHEIYIWSTADGTVWNRLGGRSRGLLAAGWSRSGAMIAWGQTNKGNTLQANLPLERTFLPADLEFGAAPDAGFRRAELTRGSLGLALAGRTAVDLKLGDATLQTFQLVSEADRVRCFSFLSADRVIVGASNSLELYDTATGKRLRCLHGHRDEVWAVAPAPNRRYLLTASLDQTVRVWDAEALLRPEPTGIGVTLRLEDGAAVVVGIRPGTPAARDGRLRIRDRVLAVASRGSQFVDLGKRKIEEIDDLINGPADSMVRLRVLQPDAKEPVEYELQRQLPPGWVGRLEPLVSLFVADNDWVAWTPEGYYAASPGGEKLMGWHINNGTTQMARFLPAERFARSLRRPDILMQLLETGSVERGRALADLLRGTKTEPLNIVQVLPPRVKITAPAKSGEKVDEEEVEIAATAESTGKHPVTAMRLLLDGRPFQGFKGVRRFDAKEPGIVKASWKVALTHGRHRLVVQADSAVSQGDSDPVELSYVIDSPPAQGRLFVLAVGIQAYKDESLKLYYAAEDARLIAKRLKDKGAPLPFTEVKTRVLTDAKATRSAILQGLEWLQKEMSANDSAWVFFSGHGERDAKGGLYLLPVDVDLGKLEETAVSGQALKNALVGLPGRQVLLVLDACHAGAAGRDRPASASVSDELAQDLSRDENGVIVMCSSIARQKSQENNEFRRGNYTLALLEGLAGKGDTASKDGIVYQHKLHSYVIERVMELTRREQMPTASIPANLPLFPLTKP